MSSTSLLTKNLPPLAERIRPQVLAEFIGQTNLVHENSLLSKAVLSNQPFSLIFWGPPGTGKTTLARVLSREFGVDYFELSAISSGVKQVREILEMGKTSFASGKRSILFIDEIHRFTKSQQDALLHAVEEGSITLMGATTENPSFEVISPLLSRSRVFVLNPLTNIQLRLIIERAIKDKEHGLGNMKPNLTDEAINGLVLLSNGDVRIGLNALEMATTVTNLMT